MSQILNLNSKIQKHLRQAILILLPLLFSLPNNAFAGLDTLVKNVFPSGTMSNVTKGAITREQEGGHLTGGSIVLKTPANPGLQLLHVQAPSCKMG